MISKKRSLIAALAAAAVAFGVGACSSSDADTNTGSGSGSTESAGGGGQRTLSVAVWSMAQTPEFQALFDAFEAKYTDIKIEPVDILAADYDTKIATMLAGGDSTDVITQKQLLSYTKYQRDGQLLDVTDIVDSIGKDKLAGLDGYEVDGKYSAIPYRQDFWLLYYNKTLFDNAGIAYPEKLTWDQYSDLACKLTTGEGENKVYGTYHHTWRSVVQAIGAAQTGTNLLDGKYDALAPQYNMAVGLQDKGCALDYATAKTQQSSYRTMFENQQTAMLPMGSWYISSIIAQKAAGATTVDWGLAQMPQIKSGAGTTTFGSPTAFSINKNAKNTDDAKKFLEFASGLEGAKAVTAIGIVPAYQDQTLTDQYFALPGMVTDALSKAAFSPDKVALEMPPSPNASDIDQILNEEHSLIMVGDMSVPDGLQEMNDRVTNEVLN